MRETRKEDDSWFYLLWFKLYVEIRMELLEVLGLLERVHHIKGLKMMH
jgi:hypothetical protein